MKYLSLRKVEEILKDENLVVKDNAPSSQYIVLIKQIEVLFNKAVDCKEKQAATKLYESIKTYINYLTKEYEERIKVEKDYLGALKRVQEILEKKIARL